MGLAFVRIAAASVLTLAAGSASANILNNGDFSELQPNTNLPADWSQSGSGTTPGKGVTVVTIGTPGSPLSTDNISAYNGTTTAVYFVDDNANESLFQGVQLVAGQQYSLTFGLLTTQSGYGNMFGASLTATIGGTILGSGAVTSSSLAPAGTWTTFTDIFTASTSTPETLEFDFNSGSTPAQDILLADVNLTATPLPSSAALLLPVFAAFGFLAMRRQGKTEPGIVAAA